MSPNNGRIGASFRIITFLIIAFLVLMAFFAANWRPTLETDFLALILAAYTLLLVLPFSKFKLGVSGFEGELERLTKNKETTSVENKMTEEVNKELKEFTQDLTDPDLALMKLSIDIETTLRDIAERLGLENTKVTMAMLVDTLRKREVLTDPWIISALDFFRKHRNELIHEGKTKDVQEAIDIGKIVLAKLRQIQKEEPRTRS